MKVFRCNGSRDLGGGEEFYNVNMPLLVDEAVWGSTPNWLLRLDSGDVPVDADLIGFNVIGTFQKIYVGAEAAFPGGPLPTVYDIQGVLLNNITAPGMYWIDLRENESLLALSAIIYVGFTVQFAGGGSDVCTVTLFY